MDRRTFLQWLGINGVGLAVLPAAAGAATASTDITVLTNATLIDGTGAPASRDTTIVLVGDRIVWTGPHGRLPQTQDARVIDLRGKYVIPGLWDMHTHWGLNVQTTIPLHIVNGVTSVREMWGSPEQHQLRDRINRGEILGPRFTIASALIDGQYSLWPTATQVVTAEEARAAVRTAKAENADFVKIYSFLLPEAFLALNDEARKVGLRIAGHQPVRIPVRQVVAAGMRSYEHLYQMPLATSREEDVLLRRIVNTPIDPANPFLFWAVVAEADMQASLSHSRSKAADLYDRMARGGTWQSPTLSVLRVHSSPPDTFVNDPRLVYMPKQVREYWAQTIGLIAPTTPEAIATHRKYLRFRLDMVNAMEKAGVGIIGGTDAGNHYVIPGFAVHDELGLLVEAGLSPMRALQTMTRDAARFLKLDKTMGTVTPGKVADLVVLDANPLTDIANTQKIHAVITRGKVITAEQRAKILADVAANAEKPQPQGAVQPACCHVGGQI